MDGKVTGEVIYLSAMEEQKHTVAQASAELDQGRQLRGRAGLGPPERRVRDEPARERHADGRLAQAARLGRRLADPVPRERRRQPRADGLEHAAPGGAAGQGRGAVRRHRHGRDRGARFGRGDRRHARAAWSTRSTPPASSSAPRARSTPANPGVDIYTLQKFQRSNQNTCINQRPLVKVGDTVEAGDIIADGPSTDLGELALGRNSLVAFMPWNGYNYEDSILISERIVKDDVFTSIHIEEFEVMARDTKLGPGRHHPRHSQRRRGSPAQPRRGGHRLHRRRSAPGRYPGRQDHAEGRKPDDAGGKAPPRDLRRKGQRRARHLAPPAAGRCRHDRRGAGVQPPRHRDRRPYPRDPERGNRTPQEGQRGRARILNRATYNRLRDMLVGQTASAAPKGVKKGAKIDEAMLDERRPARMVQVRRRRRQDARPSSKRSRASTTRPSSAIDDKFEDRKEKLERGDELAPGVLKMVKVFVAVKRKLQPGDKMAGRHGNKGVISRILPAEDMPFLEDGTPVDIVLNPLGVPSPHERRADLRDPPRPRRARPGPAGRRRARRMARSQSRPGRRPSRRARVRREAEGRLRRAIPRRDRQPLDRRSRRAGGEPAQRRSDGHPGVRRRARSRRHRHAEQGRARPFGPGRRCTTAAPARRSTAR